MPVVEALPLLYIAELEVEAVSTTEKRQVLFAYSSTMLSSDHDICASSV
jgi:hypothetical protein